MKAPEKIYVVNDDLNIERKWFKTKQVGFETTEYTRTDYFIEKACEWIEANMDDYIHVEYDTVKGMPTNEAHIAHKKVVEDFKKYLETINLEKI